MKRAFDFLIAFTGLVVLAVPLLIIALAVRLDSPGPSVFAQTRIGRHGRHFTCYKLRTMKTGTAHRPTHEIGASATTTVGRFLRRTKLDELPQLVNVVNGDMSLVGPRPCLPTQTVLIAARERTGALTIRPGITGLAQVNGIDMSEPERLAQIDGEYARARSFIGDLALILKTMTGYGVGIDHTRKQA